jgi:hypothetical protein
MNPLTPIANSVRGGFKASPDAVRAASNASNSATLNEERHEAPREKSRQRPRLQVELVCQAGTKSRDPFRDSPRLQPAFVTQLLGQVMDQERHRLVRGAYNEAGAKDGAVFDTRL